MPKLGQNPQPPEKASKNWTQSGPLAGRRVGRSIAYCLQSLKLQVLPAEAPFVVLLERRRAYFRASSTPRTRASRVRSRWRLQLLIRSDSAAESCVCRLEPNEIPIPRLATDISSQ